MIAAVPARRCCSSHRRRRLGVLAVALLLTTARQSVAAEQTRPASHHHAHGTARHRHGHHAAQAPPHAHQPHAHQPHAPSKPVPVAPPVPAPAASPPPPAEHGGNTGLPLPRFASLRADEVNMRSGPGERYPILWLYQRRGLPVEIEREFDVWRLVEDADGVKGWVHQATLVGTRTFEVTATGAVTLGSASRGGGTLLLDDPHEDGGVVAILRPGVIGRLRDCPKDSAWCRVVVHDYGGWLRRSAIFGLLPNEVITPP